MSRSGQKLKMLYLRKILLEMTDEQHSMTLAEIIRELKGYGISAERKSLYNDIENLRLYGMDIIREQKERGVHYHVGGREFQLAELKFLVDCVQASRFITVKKSRELIRKIETLASHHEASKLQRQVYVAERVKTMNESIYYNVDKLHAAIGENVKITFQYCCWDINKNLVLKRDGARYKVSPWALLYSEENYYLIGHDASDGRMKHFRVDKMIHIDATRERREGTREYQACDVSLYAKKVFGMYGGEEHVVRIGCEEKLVGVMIDRFGKDIAFTREDKDHVSFAVKVVVSRQFLGWIISLGEGVRIEGPERVVNQMRDEIDRLVKQYLQN